MPIGTYVYVSYLAYGSKHNNSKFTSNSAVTLNGWTGEKLHSSRILLILLNHSCRLITVKNQEKLSPVVALPIAVVGELTVAGHSNETTIGRT